MPPKPTTKKAALPAATVGAAATSAHLSAIFGKQSSAEGGLNCAALTREDVEQAFRFLDVRGRGVLQPKDLKERLGVFYPMMTNKEYRFLITEPRFTVDSLWNLLQHQTLQSFDPVKEAFRVYDPKDTGYIDREALSNIMRAMGYGKITSDDIDVIIRTADADGDGRISLEDFRRMISNHSDASMVPAPPAPGSPESGALFGDPHPTGAAAGDSHEEFDDAGEINGDGLDDDGADDEDRV